MAAGDVLYYESEDQPKRKEKKMATMTKATYIKMFDKHDDKQLVTGALLVLYERHRGGLWLSVAAIELAYIVWSWIA